ncbi:sensor histidine kinase [Halopseudomonas salegens]|uniref:histidine kinase n=1 Tax=Halopseudomonas salegens TaxID=1434072 RepID=A0A1H2HWX3_9GAMM|nr:DUF4118 domain-containing protein [Halopseudomonas salegens]SDU36390.1 two-component system, OmpR family, sensor histidine kinase KdpD [Halopseudomonas salegens]
MKIPDMHSFTRQDILAFSLPWVVPLIATAVVLSLLPVLPIANLVMVYLAGVLLTAVTTRIRPALVCAVLSFLAFNFFFTEPRFSLRMLHHEDILTGALMVLIALVTGHAAARLNEKVNALRDSERWNELQMGCARELSGCIDGAAVVLCMREQLAECLGWHARINPAEVSGRLRGHPREANWQEDEAGINVIFADQTGAVSDSIRLSAMQRVSDWHRSRLDVLVSLGSLAWARVQLADSLKQETLDKEREQLRSALLSSVSHDLRTPLATMIGSVTSLIDLADALSEAQRAELLANTLTEAQRLDRYIQKLLDMTRLGHGELSLDRDWVGVDDIVSVVIKRISPLLGSVHLHTDVPDGLPLLNVHAALIEQALFNVLENALRFSPPDGEVWLEACHEGEWVYLRVRDSGPGIVPEKREQIFDMFHTFSHGDQYAAGTGLGLAICRSILAAHGGQVTALETEPGHGALLQLALPVTLPEERGEGSE